MQHLTNVGFVKQPIQAARITTLQKPITNIVPYSFSIFRATILCKLWLIFCVIKAMHSLIPEDDYVVKGCTSSYQNACFLWCHSNFRVEKMESPLPPPKCLFDSHTSLCVGSIESFLLGTGWVQVWCHEEGTTWVATVSQEQTILQCSRLGLQLLSNNRVCENKTIMRTSWPLGDNVGKDS